MYRYLLRLMSIGLFLILLGTVYGASGRSAAKDEAKAHFLYWLAGLVDWPDQAGAASRKPLVIGVIGDDAFASVLDDVVKGRHIRGRHLYVIPASFAENLSRYQIVYVAISEIRHMDDIVAQTADQPILTVTDDDVNVPQGIIMVLKFGSHNRPRPAIDVKAAKRAGLRFSSRLLKLAEIKQD
jgi:hypothetical protein